MEGPDITELMNIVNNVSRWVNIVASVVNPIMIFMLPILLYVGDLLRNFILFVRDSVVIGNYTWFIVITAVTAVGAITLCFLFPGEKPENNS